MPLLRRLARECYSEPQEVYEVLKRRGMDVVTVTDHDSIDAVEPLRRHADFFLSEEVTCTTPTGTLMHVGVYDIREQDHVELQRRRRDPWSLLAYLAEQGLYTSVHHAFSGLTGRREESDFEFFEQRFPAIETRNGQMLERANRLAARWAARARKHSVGGSDAHTLACLGRTYTDVAGAQTREEFCRGLRQGRGRVHGEHGSAWKLGRAVFEIAAGVAGEKVWASWLMPAVAALPLVMGAIAFREMFFARRWARMAEAAPTAASEVWESVL
jgi:predicted metal-dependent phosphoesterase TrpH